MKNALTIVALMFFADDDDCIMQFIQTKVWLPVEW